MTITAQEITDSVEVFLGEIEARIEEIRKKNKYAQMVIVIGPSFAFLELEGWDNPFSDESDSYAGDELPEVRPEGPVADVLREVNRVNPDWDILVDMFVREKKGPLTQFESTDSDACFVVLEVALDTPASTEGAAETIDDVDG